MTPLTAGLANLSRKRFISHQHRQWRQKNPPTNKPFGCALAFFSGIKKNKLLEEAWIYIIICIIYKYFWCLFGYQLTHTDTRTHPRASDVPRLPPPCVRRAMEESSSQKLVWDGDAKAVQQCLTDIFTSVYTTCDIPENAIFGPCVLSHTSLYDSIAFVALKSTDKRTAPYIFRVSRSIYSLIILFFFKLKFYCFPDE